MLRKFVSLFARDPNKRAIEQFRPLVDYINSLESAFESLTDEALRGKTDEFRARLTQGEELDNLLPEAFAAVREASKRKLGMRHYDVQLIGGIALHQGSITEMRTGEGKTLVATLPLYLNALTGSGAHLVTVNDYLARRDARWMGTIYTALGLSVGVLQISPPGENIQSAYLVDLNVEASQEAENQLRKVSRKEAYQADITYGTNSEFGFDYLRDNMTMTLEERVQRGHAYAIVDEVDNVLIDEARTPLIISGPASEETEWYTRMAEIVKKLNWVHVEVDHRNHAITLTESGEARVEQLLGVPLRDPARPEDVSLEQARLMGYLEQALRAQFLYKREKDYLVMNDEVVIIDEFTGRTMPGRRWSSGLHQAVEAKEGVQVQPENVTYATVTLQNYFRMYKRLAGMTGTALTEAEEFDNIYKLKVTAIPTNLEYLASSPDSHLVELHGQDEDGHPYSYYANKNDSSHKPVFWRRIDFPDAVFLTDEAKFRAITTEILQNHARGRPVLVGTTSVEMSERLSRRLGADLIGRLATTLLIRSAWLEKNARQEDGGRIPELQPLDAPLEKPRSTFIRKMIEELNLPQEPDAPANVEHLATILELKSEDRVRLLKALQLGIPHNTLNARRHTEESQIIAAAGGFGSVTIATNMAGRGVDIKLGGDLAEEVIARVGQVLHKAGYDPSYKTDPQERKATLTQMVPSQFAPFESEVSYYLKHLEEMQHVWDLGGLHVIGSERHEARRIDNQLRGRAARQGDPGSSRFYVSLEDRLLVDYGGQSVEDLAERLEQEADEALPLQSRIADRLVEQAQTRIEGTNFEIRKHLVDYDDVLNTQRTKVYDQRDRILKKGDLIEDVTSMIRTEALERLPKPPAEGNGSNHAAWELLAWLEEVQPPLLLQDSTVPSYTLRLIMEQLMVNLESQPTHDPGQALLENLVKIADQALAAEEDHLLSSVETLVDQHLDRLEGRLDEHQGAMDDLLQSLEDMEENEGLTGNELLEAIASVLNTPINMSSEQKKALQNKPEATLRLIYEQFEKTLVNQELARLVGAVERRLGESIHLDPASIPLDDWDAFEEQVITATERVLKKKREGLLGDAGQEAQNTHRKQEGEIVQELKQAIEMRSFSFSSDTPASVKQKHLVKLLLLMSQGEQSQLGQRRRPSSPGGAARLSYSYYASQLVQSLEPEQLSADIVNHLEGAQQELVLAWGKAGPEGMSGATPDMIETAGRKALSEIYRQLLLTVTGDLWVEYLTKMEALRVSVILEGYGQRDPLVMYKSQAFKLFQGLLRDMRQGVVSRIFTFIPRSLHLPVPREEEPGEVPGAAD
jgi:preprotein translocase subunit SecA